MTEAVQKFRSLLRYVETPSTKRLRQSLARQLAELLLRVVCTGKYHKYLISSERDSVKSLTTAYLLHLL